MENRVEYQISSSMSDGFIELVVSGNATGSNFEKMINEVDVILKTNHSKKAIFDIRELKGRIEPGEIYRFVRTHSSIIYEIQSVIVDLPENASYHTATKNAGLSLMWFTDMDTARKWLKK